MTRQQLIDLLRCPETGLKVHSASVVEISRLNKMIQSTGSATELVDEALIREDGRVAFPIRQGIPVMTMTGAISCDF